MGLDPELLSGAYTALQQAKETSEQSGLGLKNSGINSDVGRVRQKKNFVSKELIYEDEQAFIYQRGDTKSQTYYLRIFDEKSRKPFVKSLKTTDRAKALVTARTLYQQIKGKLDRGERLVAINTPDLIEKYLSSLHITDIPHAGITPQTLVLKKYLLSNWLDFITELGYRATPIDRLPDDKLRNFGKWFHQRPRRDGRTGERCVEQINNAISEVRLAYYKVAVADRFISSDRVPNIERLKQQPDDRYKRDIFTLEQYECYWKYLEYTYTREKGLKALEKQRRIMFTKVVGILVNTGLRPKELIGVKWKDIAQHHTADPKLKNKVVVIHIPASNSKTGRSRNVVAPVRKRFDIIRKSYKDLGEDINPNDYVLFNPQKKDRSAYTRMMLYQRLKDTLVSSGIQAELDKLSHSISLYSFRHQYICWRLRYGHTPIHLIAKNCGTSIQKIDQTYGHLETEKHVDEITKNQGISQRVEVDLNTMILDTE